MKSAIKYLFDRMFAKVTVGRLYVPAYLSAIDRSAISVDSILRATRALAGAVILLTIVTAILVPQVLPVSGNSFVNARLEWIRTPIEGDLTLGEFTVGDDVSSGTVLGVITNKRADDYFLNQLKSEKSMLESSLYSLINRRQNLHARSEELEKKVRESLHDLERKMQKRLEIISNEMAQAIDEKASVVSRIARYERANKEYGGEERFAVVSRSMIEALVDREMELKTSIASQQAAISLLQSDLQSALSRSFVSESTPLEHQQLIETELTLKSIESEINSLTLRADKLASQVDARVLHLDNNAYHELVAGAKGALWDIGFPDGSFVNEGDPVVAIADTNALTVEGNFHQRYLDNISIGDSATIDLMGSSRRLSGTVSDVRIRDHIKSTDLSAFNLEKPASNEFKVIVSLDEGQIGSAGIDDVYVGQRAKVIINNTGSSLLPALLLFFN